MKQLRLIDSSVLALFQKFSDWTYEMFGISNFTLARVCVIICATLIGIMGFLAGIPFILIVYIHFRYIVSHLMYIRKIEDSLGDETSENRFMNSVETEQWGMRLIHVAVWMFAAPLTFTLPFIPSFQALNVCGKYFLACTPMPPGTSKFRQFLNALGSFFGSHNAPAPA